MQSTFQGFDLIHKFDIGSFVLFNLLYHCLFIAFVFEHSLADSLAAFLNKPIDVQEVGVVTRQLLSRLLFGCLFFPQPFNVYLEVVVLDCQSLGFIGELRNLVLELFDLLVPACQLGNKRVFAILKFRLFHRFYVLDLLDLFQDALLVLQTLRRVDHPVWILYIHFFDLFCKGLHYLALCVEISG